MLGIGFIIAHFVAMQKPQQRKYHSSCDRSVHRGTAHGNQRVKVCKRKTPHLFLMRSFLSPYGDGTSSTSTISSVQTGFRPLTGIVRKPWRRLPTPICFRPLTGIVQLSRVMHLLQSRFRPLTGIVPAENVSDDQRCGFRPLTGIVRFNDDLPR